MKPQDPDAIVKENEEIIRMVRESVYPPTNPAVLLRAARWAYLEGRQDDMVMCLAWVLNITQMHATAAFRTDAQRKAARDFAVEMGAF